MKLLVTGGGGQLGRAMARLKGTSVEIVARTRAELDIAEEASIARALDAERPDALVNAAAFTNVDRAETDRAAAFRGNEAGPLLLARAAASAGIPLIHVSTDFVFDGATSRPYQPEDPVAPLNVYGESKLAGEHAVLDADPAALVVRTSWLYWLGGRNFMTTIVRLLREKGQVSVVDDQHGTPTSAVSLAEVLLLAARKKAAGEELSGIRHYADAGVTSRYDFALAIRDQAVAAGLVAASASVEPVATSPDAPVRRPAFSALDSRRMAAELGVSPLSWRAALARDFREDRGLLPF